MSADNPVTVALREVFGPLVRQTAKLPAPLAYGAALVLALLVSILLGATIGNELAWLLVIVILASLGAFVFADWDTRRRAADLTNLNASATGERAIYPTALQNVHFERKIGDQIGELGKLHERYDRKRGEIIPLAHLLSALRPLFNRKTFDEPIPECVDENWQDRLCAVVQVEYILDVYWAFVKEAANQIADGQALIAYETVQKELRRYSQDMTGLFQPRPQVADVEEQFLAGRLEEIRDELRGKRIIPKSRIPESVIEACEQHRKNVVQEVHTWPAISVEAEQEPVTARPPQAPASLGTANLPSVDHAKLRSILEDRYSLEELRTLSFDLGVDYASLPGEGKSAKARELIAYLRRRNRLDSLIRTIRHERGGVF